jgi:hypothetical protein
LKFAEFSQSAGLARFNFFPRADSLLKTRRDTRTVRFIDICCRVGVRQIDSARSNFYLAVADSGFERALKTNF